MLLWTEPEFLTNLRRFNGTYEHSLNFPLNLRRVYRYTWTESVFPWTWEAFNVTYEQSANFFESEKSTNVTWTDSESPFEPEKNLTYIWTEYEFPLEHEKIFNITNEQSLNLPLTWGDLTLHTKTVWISLWTWEKITGTNEQSQNFPLNLRSF